MKIRHLILKARQIEEMEGDKRVQKHWFVW